MKNFKDEIKLLKILQNPLLNKGIKANIIKRMHKRSILNLAEIILNILNGNLKVDDQTKNSLRPFAKIYRKFLDKKSTIKKKKQILITSGLQTGGFLQFLIPAIISGIASIIGSVISSNKQPSENTE